MRYRRSAAGLVTLALCLGLAGAGASAQQAGAPADAPPGEAPFLAENAAAMDRMMAGMEVKPTGDVDADFTAMMIPHHQGAIDMAVAYLRYGKNEQLRRIAQEIVVEQQQEIAAMRLALGQELPPSAPVPTQVPDPGAAPSPLAHSPMPDRTSPGSPAPGSEGAAPAAMHMQMHTEQVHTK